MNQPNTDEPRDDEFEAQLRDHAASFRYPTTPDVAGKVRQRMARPALYPARRVIAWALLIVLLALCGLVAVPEVRASILNWLRIGNIRIFLPEATITALPSRAPLGGTPVNRDLNSMAGRMTLAEVRRRVAFNVLLPAALGEPDYVYLQAYGGDVVILIWVDHDQPDRILYMLQIIDSNVYIDKMQPTIIERTQVNGHKAVWAVGPYMLAMLRNGKVDLDAVQLVAGNTLIWADDTLTYRFESRLTMEEAITIAESLR